MDFRKLFKKSFIACALVFVVGITPQFLWHNDSPLEEFAEHILESALCAGCEGVTIDLSPGKEGHIEATVEPHNKLKEEVARQVVDLLIDEVLDESLDETDNNIDNKNEEEK